MDPRYFVIGNPVAHSLSPLVHNMALRDLGLGGTYEALALTEEKLPEFFLNFRTAPYAGCNITLPLKVAAVRQVDELTERARQVGAINTVYWHEGRLVGENTDVVGYMAPLQGRTFARALILGAGGVSRAAIVALKALGVPSIVIANRTLAKAESLAREFGIELCPWEARHESGADLVINATSLGMQGKNGDLTPFEHFQGRGDAYDIVYTPEKTRFLCEAEAAGWQTQSGLVMFVEQARASFRLWTGRDMDFERAVRAVRGALASRA